MPGPDATTSLRAVPVAQLSAGLLNSVIGRFGVAGGPDALVELGLLHGRSATRYRSAAVLPIRQWHLLYEQLHKRDGDRAATLFPEKNLARIGAALHQQTDEAEAAYRDLRRTHRLGIQATPAAVDAAGERLLAGERLDGTELLLVPRYVRANTTPRGLRSKGLAAVYALRAQLDYSQNPSDGYHDVLVREALRNLDVGPAAETAVDVLDEMAADNVCPCTAAREMPYLDSARGPLAVASMFATHNCARHEDAMWAALTYRLREPFELLHQGSALTYDSQVVASHYLARFAQSSKQSSADRSLAARLLEDVQEQLGWHSDDDRAAVASARLCDRTDMRLDNDPVVRWLWQRMLLGTDFDEPAMARDFLRNLGVAPEPWLLRLAQDNALSTRLRINALQALGTFGGADTEPALRAIASDPVEQPAVRTWALWSYRAGGADTTWMYSLLADPQLEVREALIYAARNDCVGVTLAATTDPDPGVSRLALQEVRRLSAAGRLGPISVGDT